MPRLGHSFRAHHVILYHHGELQVLTRHYVHQVWHILLSPSPQIFVDPSHEPPSLWPLDFRVIQWHIPKDDICLIEFFGCISFGLITVLEFDIKIH